ncbi:unnamed protein product [Gordionus sp. m RMFG-2023]
MMDDIPTISREITSPVLPIFNDCTGGILIPHQITSHVLTSVNDCIPTISREITSPVLPIFNDCTGGILTPHQITSHVLTSVNDCIPTISRKIFVRPLNMPFYL